MGEIDLYKQTTFCYGSREERMPIESFPQFIFKESINVGITLLHSFALTTAISTASSSQQLAPLTSSL